MTREHQGPIHGETKNLKVKSGNWLGEEEQEEQQQQQQQQQHEE